MKKFYLYMISALLLSAGAMTFTSCDDDVLDSMDLSGEWAGDMGTSIYLDGYNYRSVSTYIAFYRTNSTGGYGEEIDYFDHTCPYHHQNYYFRWWINRGTLYMEYPGNRDLDIALYDYYFYYSHGMMMMGFSIDGYRYGLYKLHDYYEYYGYYYGDYYSYNDWMWWNSGSWHNTGYYYYNTPGGYYSKQREGSPADAPTRGESIGMESSKEIKGYSVKRDFSDVKPIGELVTPVETDK